MSTADLNHSARELLKARLPAHLLTRADRVRALDEIYVTRADDGKFQMELELIMAHILNENAHEGYAVAVTGPTGAGKTTLVNARLDETKALAPFDDGYGNEVEFCLRVQTPSSCTAKDLGVAILRATGYPLERTPNEIDVWNLVRKRLRLKMHKIIFLDEFQHVLKGAKTKGMPHLTNQVKLLMQDREWPVWLIFAGVPDMMEFVERDIWFQMERRVRPLELDNLENATDDLANVEQILLSLAESARLSVGFPLTDNFLSRLSHGGLWRFGMTVQLIKLALEVALWDEASGTELNYNHFREGYRRLSNCTKKSNVFIADNWHNIQREVGGNGRLTSRFQLVE